MPKRPTCPRLLTDVLQAIADVGGAQGCTVKKILKQVEESILIKNVKPKPRNVVMQVRKAVNHGISKGLLTQRYGKVYLMLGKKRNATSKAVVNRRKRSAHERLSSGTPTPRKQKREDTPSSKYSSYFPSSRPRSSISADLESYSDKRLSRDRKKKVGPRGRKNSQLRRNGSNCSRRTSKNCVEIPRDDEINVPNEGNDGNPDCDYNPDLM